jgi:Flp pilus assembly protein TadG
LTEFAVVLPVAILLLALAATGGQMLVTDINITQAARAGAVAAQYQYNQSNTTTGTPPATTPCTSGTTLSPEICFATVAAEQELGVTSIPCKVTGSVPSGCLQVTFTQDSVSGQPMTQVTVWDTIQPYIPIFPGVTIKANATAPS